MNIFTVLNQGNSRLHETSMSAVLAYFLDPREDHGLRDTFLCAFLQLLRPGIPRNYTDLLAESTVELEKPFTHKGKNGFFDIEIALQDSSKEAAHYFIIENKINAGAAQPEQLKEYYGAARNESERGDKPDRGDKPITVVFLTPAGHDQRLQAEYDNLETKRNDHKVWLYWKGEKGEDESIQKAICDILQQESIGKISPIGEYVKHTLKAFAMHLNQVNTINKKSATGATHRAPISAGLNETYIEICGYKITKVLPYGRFFVHDENGNKVKAFPALREIVEKERLPVSETNDNGKLNTAQFGREVWNAIKARETKLADDNAAG